MLTVRIAAAVGVAGFVGGCGGVSLPTAEDDTETDGVGIVSIGPVDEGNAEAPDPSPTGGGTGNVGETDSPGAGTSSDAGGSGGGDGQDTGSTSAGADGPGDEEQGGNSEGGGETSASNPDSGGAEDSGDGCPDLEVSFEPRVPTVVLLIDQSGSMNADFGTQTRWDAVRTALIDPVNGALAALEDEVRFGLSLYTSNNGDAGGTCPVLTEETAAIGNLAAITAVYNAASPVDETPTGESIDAVAAALLADPDPGPKVIVLATDGEPDTCAVPNPQTGLDESVAAAQAAFAAGIETYIISVGNDIGEPHLQDMANAGLGVGPGDPDAAFYVPSDQAALVSTFETIINGVRECVFDLDAAIVAGEEDEGTVTVNGAEVPLNDPDGWQVNSPTQIELVGAACAAIQEGDVQVSIEFTCGSIIPQ